MKFHKLVNPFESPRLTAIQIVFRRENMTKNLRFISLAISLLFCFVTLPVFAQETTGSIEGTVRDQNDAVVPGISVTVQSTGATTGFNRTVSTDDNGFFIVSSLPVGNYRVTVAEAKGFKGANYDTTVVLGKTSPANFKLEVGSGTSVVDVTGDESAIIDATESKLTTNITKQVFDALPKGTTFTSLLKTAPNVRNEPLAGGFQVDGASGAENVYVIDGQEVTNFNTGTLNTNNNIPFELVQEVQIKSTGFEAEYGGATGGVINVVTAGGNNQWRGNFGISFQPSKLQGAARPILQRFSNASTATNQAANGFEYFKAAKLGGTSYFPVANLSGPVIKDKVWLSATYAPQLFDTTAAVPFFVDPNQVDAQGRNIPSADPGVRRLQSTQNFNYKFKVEEAFVRLDAQPTSKLRMYGTFLWNPIIEQGASLGYAGTVLTPAFGLTNLASVNPSGPIVSAEDFYNNQGGRQNANNINAQVSYSATNNLILNFRGGRSFLNQKLQSYGLPNALRYVCSVQGAPQNVPGSSCNQGFSNFPSNFQNAYDTSYRTTFDADANLVGVNLGGRHNLKFGYQYNGISNDVNQGYRDSGIVVLFYGLALNQLCCNITPTPGNLGAGYIQRFQTIGKASSSSQSFFVQDSWQIANRLTLNVGLRAEVEDVPSFSENNPGIKFGLGDKLAPRLGFAFDVFGDGKSKIFGSYGWFYDRFKYQLPRGSFGGDFFRRDWFEILPTRGAAYSSYTRGNILGTGFPDPIGGTDCDSNTPIVPNGYAVCNQDFRIPSNSGLGIETSGAVDPNLKAARQSEYTFGFEHQLFKSMAISARFTHKKVDRAIEDIGLPNAGGSEAYIIGNPGYGLACEVATDNDFQCTKAQRDFKALEVRVDKRLSNSWFFNASYTLSRLYGNYSGLASSDEAGRTSPNVNRFFDLPFLGYTASGEPDNGRLATDRPHVFKAYGGYIFDWFGNKANSTDLSFFTTIQSGTPLTTNWNFYQVASAVLFSRGDLGRTATFTETDFSIKHTYKFGRDARFAFQPYLNIRNLFDEDSELGRQTLYNVSNMTAATLVRGGCPAAVCSNEFTAIQRIFNGGITQYVVADVNANPSARLRNDYNLPNLFQAPREVRFGFRLFF